jgi:hypothetical protein
MICSLSHAASSDTLRRLPRRGGAVRSRLRARLAATRPDRRVHVLIVPAGKCVAACRRPVLRWPRRGTVHPLYQEGGARDVR